MEPQDVVTDRIVRELLMPGRNTSNSTISVNAGGVGVWIAVSCCVVMLVALLVGAVVTSQWMSREFMRIDVTMSERKEEADRMQTYLSAIYAQAPHLKPKDEGKKDAE